MNKTGYGHEMILAVSSLKPPHPRYRGRFAPSPTGPLHAGSLASALGSWLDARSNQGAWLVRIEDLDAPRCIAGMDQRILAQLQACGLTWDEEVLWQSQQLKTYQNVLETLYSDRQIYPCTCSRQQITSALSSQGKLRARNQEQIYPGTCRHGYVWQAQLPEAMPPSAWRLALKPEQVIRFSDAELGSQEQNLNTDVGDFVLLRADGIVAYQLAVVVDDARQGITHIVRGADLLSNTARQIYLQGILDYPTPQYRHLPLVLDPHGEKLSKQTQATEINTASEAAALQALQAAALHLGLRNLSDGQDQTIAEWLLQATHAWADRTKQISRTQN
ncbi:tRNA glutamyl-Q(34) synthetase GluQRS [Polynucleobacter sp.]|uniref:tRNA glutamyl-Q(34) synthetase GluQRS n=1 Tax=Polynucleobacter sp. TaxID=2029855 RepID=UPI002732C354|nr:tRNA glutamyl-Q(34) synthetase GluQRS [Polynucleobacter sp.]MDP3121239.1 tRNA glutamyl-Q(34) synthetase GluQRS [Polynucleobacter sp.]